MGEDNEAKLEIDWVRTVGGALAAVSSAVALSTLGAAGTIIGAALGSVIITVGGALYSHGLVQSRKRLADAQTVAMRKVGIAQAEVRRASSRKDERAAEAHLAHADESLSDAKEDLDALAGESTPPSWRERFESLPWKRVLLVAAGLFAAAVLTITGFEMLAGRSVSQLTGGTDGDGGTTISRLGGGGSERHDEAPVDEEVPEQQEEPSDAPSEDVSESPAEDTPSPTPTATESSEPALPTEPAPVPSE